jgi:hypothetical protein
VTARLRTLSLDPGRALAHAALASAATVVLLLAGVVALGGGLGGWLLLGWLAVAFADAGYVLWRRFLHAALEGYPDEIPQHGQALTGSISSTVVLDYDRGTAEKRYHPTLFVRSLYWLSFQARFPYSANADALEAARHRRAVVGLLCRYWLGIDPVAGVLEIRKDDDGYAFVTELVPGGAPRDRARAKAFLSSLTGRFLEAGLPPWQVAHYNPRAVGNLVETPDGGYHLIDFESNLVTPFLPLPAIVRAVRLGQYPSFDDVDVERLRGYVAAEREPLRAALGDEATRLLEREIEALAEAQSAWLAAEPRWPSRVLRFAFRLVDVPSWVREVRRIAARGERQGDAFVRSAIDEWRAEGRLTAEEAATLRRALGTPEVAQVIANLGVHLAITVPLRFPFGSLTRFSWTLASRLRAEWRAVRRRGSAHTARRVHSIPVMLVTLLPSVGSGAYLISTPLRQQAALEAVALDGVLRRLPLGLHRRLHLAELMSWLAHPKPPPLGRAEAGGLLPALAQRGRQARSAWRPLALVVGVNSAILALAAGLYYSRDSEFALGERGLIATLDAAELLVAGVLGILTFRLFWRGAQERAGAAERGGIFLWGASGIGLIAFAIDDFLSIHERAGAWVADNIGVLPLLTNNVDDMITLAYGLAGLLVLRLFRHEVLALRPSSAIYAAGVVAAGAMLLTDAYARGPVSGVEFPAQVTAVGLLLVAHLLRYAEVRAALGRPLPLPVVPAATAPAGRGSPRPIGS